MKNLEVKNEKCEAKSEKGCCGGHCACGHSKCIRIIIKVVMILIILSIGICIGRHSQRFTGRNGYGSQFGAGRNGENFGGCPMMRGEFKNGQAGINNAPTIAVSATAATSTK